MALPSQSDTRPVVVIKKKGPQRVLREHVKSGTVKTLVTGGCVSVPETGNDVGSSQPPPAREGKTKSRQRQVLEMAFMFMTRWPEIFPHNYSHLRPWALNIHEAIASHFPDLPMTMIKGALSVYLNLAGRCYLRKLIEGGPRYGLDGTVQGEVTPEEQERAKYGLDMYLLGFAHGRKLYKANTMPSTQKEMP